MAAGVVALRQSDARILLARFRCAFDGRGVSGDCAGLGGGVVFRHPRVDAALTLAPHVANWFRPLLAANEVLLDQHSFSHARDELRARPGVAMGLGGSDMLSEEAVCDERP